jgi:hypothetical protein
LKQLKLFFEVHSHTHNHKNGNRPHNHTFDFKGSGSTSQSGTIPQSVKKNLMNYKEAWKNLKKRADGHLTGNGYTHEGHPNESEIISDMGPNNTPEKLWKASSNFVKNETNRIGPDGGWNYTINGVTPESGYLSIVYFKIPDDSKKNGGLYHGCATGNKTLYTNGDTYTNPYFVGGTKLYDKRFNVDEWYVSIGVILPYKEGCYPPDSPELETIGGIYRLSTREQFRLNKNFMMNPDKSIQSHRTFQFYSTNPNSEIYFARPGFYKMDGSEPTLEDILNLQNID